MGKISTQILVPALSLILFGCGKMSVDAKTVAQASGGAQTPSAPPPPRSGPLKVPPPPNSVLYLQIDSQYEDSTGYTTHLAASQCSIPSGQVRANLNCNVYIPEDQLYFSKLSFTVGGTAHPASGCEEIVFHPYSYAAPAGQHFWGLCDPPNAAVGCYGGTAQWLIPGYPASRYLYFLFDSEAEGAQVQRTYGMPFSTNELARTASGLAGFQMIGQNNLTCNSKTDRNAGFTSPDGFDAYFGGNLWQDYEVRCYDRWGQVLYSIGLTISDDPAQSGYQPSPGYIPGRHRSLWQ